ncbi:hypothetical protein [Brevundimonas lenta]|uniref:Lipoprotein n=1 Tax=Brevundimonas lenta TaxID=424796 RepID=A0A7W6NQD7_9CAUL|nr:hypothetical protein [Brevundimonas lenta]MBB4083102.1 hypothetical protein [Brevundimonas lenta]
MKHPLLFLTALVGLTACDAQVESRREAVPAAENPAPAQAADPLVASGPAATVRPDVDVNLQYAASVVQLDPLIRQGDATVKLMGTGGGDPAMNGLYTYVAFFHSPAEGWRVFRVGDFLSYRVLSEAPGRVDIEVEESVMNAATGMISGQKRRLILGWTVAPDGSPPAGVTVTPAQ